MAEPIAAISVTINGNALTGEYTQAVAGAETEPYSEAVITSTDLQVSKHLLKLMLHNLIGLLLQAFQRHQDTQLSHII